MRIIGGSLRGRDLGPVPVGVRPTGDRVRESIFASLGDVTGQRALDLFAGTGAMGLEAYSRGAGSVVFVERSRPVLHSLRHRIERLGLTEEDRIRVIGGEAGRALRRLEQEAACFDLVFVDPPYAETKREPLLETLFGSRLLSPGAVVVVEGPKRHALSAVPGARDVDQRRYGETLVTWLAPMGVPAIEE